MFAIVWFEVSFVGVGFHVGIVVAVVMVVAQVGILVMIMFPDEIASGLG